MRTDKQRQIDGRLNVIERYRTGRVMQGERAKRIADLDKAVLKKRRTVATDNECLMCLDEIEQKMFGHQHHVTDDDE